MYALLTAFAIKYFSDTPHYNDDKQGSRMSWIQGDQSNIPSGCDGALEIVTSGVRPIDSIKQNKILVSTKKKIVLRGWIGSPQTQLQVPIIKLVQIDGEKREVMIPAMPMERPDVVLAKQNSLLNRSGFRAEGILPTDLPLGDYQMIAECRSGEIWEQYIAPCKISVEPPSVVGPLDAPYEQAAAAAAAQVAQQALQVKNAPAGHKK